jgi:hypothetical protein
MTIGEALTNMMFGRSPSPKAVEIGLAWHGQELSDPGYQRLAVPLREWQIKGNQATAEVTFGPFTGTVDIDGSIIAFDGAQQMTPFADGSLHLLPGVELVHQQTVRVA